MRNATMNVSASGMLGLILGGIALVLSIPVYALSFGDFEVKSTLDEPLKAEIPLHSVDAGTLKSLKITLGSRDDFQRADVPRPKFLQQLKFQVSTQGQNPVVEVSTDQPVKEPFLHFLVSAEWNGGKLVREYTGLIDPPMYAASEPAEVQSPTAAPATTSTASTGSPTAVGAGTGSSASMAGASKSSGEAAGSGPWAEYGPTRKGDTLWSIASKLDTSSLHVNVFQVMIALLRQNPDAFIDHNINLLKTGRTLRLKDVASIADVSSKEASVAYTSQLAEWQAYKTRVASTTGETKMPSEQTPGEGTSGGKVPAQEPKTSAMGVAKATGAAKSVSATEQASATTGGRSAQQGRGNVLRIVQASVDKSQRSQDAGAGADPSGEIAQLRGQINTLQEALDSKNLENKDLTERVRLLESQVKNAQRLVNVQDKELAAAQAQAANRETGTLAEAGADEAVGDQVSNPPASVGEAVPAQNQRKAAGDSSGESMPTSNDTQGAAGTADKAGPGKEQKQGTLGHIAKTGTEEAAVAPTASQSAAKQPWSSEIIPRIRRVLTGSMLASWWSRVPDLLFSSWMWMVGAAAGVLVLLLGLLMFLRRRQSIAEFEESILSGSALDSYSETTDTAATSSSDTSFLSDFGTAGMGTMQADEVDPLAEAEVYLAYGRDEQAEEVLKEAARRDPDRSEIKLKLLEIYKQRNDVKSFETIAEELYPASDQGDPEVWRKVTAMGRELNPSNPLFQGPGASGGAAAAAPVPRPENAADAGAPGYDRKDAPVGVDRSPARAASPTGPEPMDLDVALNEPPAAGVAASRDDGALDFDDDFLKQSSRNVDPAMQPFPAPDHQAELDRELERLASEREAATTNAMNPRSQAEGGNGAEASSSGLGSEIEFDLNLDESSIQQLTASDTRQGSKSLKASNGGSRASGNGGTSLEFESGNILPEAVPESEGSAVSYSPAEGAHSSGGHQYNEAETKLDLARAYLDMGDKVGARSIIDEVMREGDPVQRDQAAELASHL